MKPIAALCVAFWPVLIWWISRTNDSSDDALGLAAVALLLAVTLSEKSTLTQWRLGWPELAVVGAYAASFYWAPNIVRGLFFSVALGIVVGRVRGTGTLHLGTWGLLALTLPLMASLRFFLGYPLRWITTEMTAILLKLGGLIVEPRGLALIFGPIEVWVDGPCSGVQMLWVGVFLAFALSFVFRLNNLATLGLFGVALISTVAGNISRAAGVFYMEAGLIEAPPIAHELIGLAAFAIVAAGVASTGFWLRTFERSVRVERGATPNIWVALCVILFAAAVPTFTPDSNASAEVSGFPGWPTSLEDQPLIPRELSERDQPYLAGFPGRIAAFRSGNEEVLIRWVANPTRRLHSAADCYRGLGFEVKPMKSVDGYAIFEVKRDGVSLIVKERINDPAGKSYEDVGGWYWSAMLGRTHGPWWNIVRVSQAPEATGPQ